MKNHLLSFLFFFLLLTLKAQYILRIEPVEMMHEQSGNLNLNANHVFSTEPEREKYLNQVLISFYKEGFLRATIDSVKKDSSLMIAYLNTGFSYEWAEINKGNVDEEALNEIGFRDKIFRGRPFNPEEVKLLMDRILVYYENNGYPFASVKLDSIGIEAIQDNPGKISASLLLTKNQLFSIDSIIVSGDAKISDKYLQNYISIKPGDKYNEKLFRSISIRMKELPFISEKKAPQIAFTENSSILYLFLNDKKASSINGVLGILPDAYNTSETQFIGEARIKLLNSVGRGELLDLNWRKMQSLTNDLKVLLNYPFLLNTPFGADFSFKLYKRDTTFIDINQVYGLQYMLGRGNNFRAFIGNQTLNLISTKGYENITVLPNFADIKITSYGLGFKAEKLDYRLNPRRGLAFDISGSAGKKEIRKNAKINASVYDSLKLKSIQYNTALELDAFIPLFRQSTIMLGLRGARLFNETIFANELFRIGGLHTLRGFDEESINASFYSVFTAEYRYLLEQNSYAMLFFDGAYYENNSLYYKGKFSDFPFGFGTGLSFETKAGIFSLVYALGRQMNNPILIKTGKVHFGFVNYF